MPSVAINGEDFTLPGDMDTKAVASMLSRAVRALSAHNDLLDVGEVNIREHGAIAMEEVGGENLDCTPFILAAANATPIGHTLVIPDGRFQLKTPLHINRAINIRGSGPRSCWWINLTDPTGVGVTYGGDNFSGGTFSAVNACQHRGFAIMGPAGSCKYGVAYLNTSRMLVENVHVKPGSTSHAVVVAGAILGYYNFIIQDNTASSYYSGTGDWCGAGINVMNLRNWTGYVSGTVLPTNHVVFNCLVEGGTTTGGFCQETQYESSPDTVGGYNVIMGCYEGLQNASGSTEKGAGYGILVEDCVGFLVWKVHDELTLHGAKFTGCSRFSIKESDFSPINNQVGEKLRIEDCEMFAVEDSFVGLLDIDPTTCRQYRTRGVRGNVLFESNYSLYADQKLLDMDYSSSIIYQSAGVGDSLAAHNLIPNGNLARGNTFTRIGSAITVAPNTTYRLGNHTQSLRITRADNTGLFACDVPDWAQYIGHPLTVWAWVRNASSAVTVPLPTPTTMGFGVYHQSGFHVIPVIAHTTPATDAPWVQVAMTVYPQTGGGSLQVILYPFTNLAYDFYLGEIGACIGLNAPCAPQAYSGAFDESIQIGTVRQEVGTVAPASGAHVVGDIAWNTGAAAGGKVGWVCTVAGTPGTWKAFGPIDP